MGRIVTIYLTDAESVELKDFCDENQCTQYSALKTAVRELLSKPLKKAEEMPLNTPEEETSEEDPEGDEAPEETRQTEKPDTLKTSSLLRRLREQRRQFNKTARTCDY